MAAGDKEQHLVGIAEMKLSDSPTVLLTAPNLGSCLGVAVYDMRKHCGGLVHCLVPLSAKDPQKAAEKPCMYVDTGVSELLSALLKTGSRKEDLKIRVAGGAQINDTNGFFEIGKKNYTVLRKILWKNNLLISSEHVGGDTSRTISLDIETGQVFVKTAGQTIPLE